MPTQDERQGQRVVFLWDDPFGAWKGGEEATDRGWESDHPDAPHLRLIELEGGQVLSIWEPYTRGIIAAAAVREVR